MYEYSASLVRVIDGDTYELSVDLGFSIHHVDHFRLAGADTPEVFGKRASPEGREASAFVKKLLDAQPKEFVIRTLKDKRGKYGRYLADLQITLDQHGEPLPTPVWLSGYLISEKIAKPM